MRYITIILFVILSAAVIMDFYFDRIYNEWILAGMIAGLIYAVQKGGGAGLITAVVSMSIPVFILYPLFMIGTLGAGDIKLLSVVGCFFTVKETFLCIAISFVIGAILSLLKMLAEHNFLQRMNYLMSYILDVFQSKEWKFYEEEIMQRKQSHKGRIHFALPVLLAAMIYKGGLLW